MRRRLTKMLETDECDEDTTAIVRSFWSRAIRLPAPDAARGSATVVDIAEWVRSRCPVART